MLLRNGVSVGDLKVMTIVDACALFEMIVQFERGKNESLKRYMKSPKAKDIQRTLEITTLGNLY